MAKYMIEKGTELSNEQIVNFVESRQLENTSRLDKLWDYYQVKDPPIVNRKFTDSEKTDHKTPVGFARKLVNTIIGYMFRPGYITYESENEKYDEQIKEYNDLNKEQIKTAKLGMLNSIFGESYELHYGSKDIDGKKTPGAFFTDVDPREVVLVLDDSIEPDVACVIRFYDSATKDNITEIKVYYADKTVSYEQVQETNGSRKILKEIGSEPNYIGLVPWNYYINTVDMQGDFEVVQKLIDNYDEMMSDSMNEFSAFSNAYLKILGARLTKEEVRDIKRKKVIELPVEGADASFLTKTIDTAFIDTMADRTKQLIHLVSQVPDFTDKQFAGDLSGVAIQRLLFDFETMAAMKQAYFEDGLYRRYKIVNAYYTTIGAKTGEVDELQIDWKRNLPNNLAEIAQTATLLRNNLSRATVISTFPDNLIGSVEEEMVRIDEDSAKEFDSGDYYRTLSDEKRSKFDKEVQGNKTSTPEDDVMTGEDE